MPGRTLRGIAVESSTSSPATLSVTRLECWKGAYVAVNRRSPNRALALRHTRRSIPAAQLAKELCPPTCHFMVINAEKCSSGLRNLERNDWDVGFTEKIGEFSGDTLVDLEFNG